MPRPCPKCNRPVPDTRKACLYCGTVAPEGGPASDPPAAGAPLPGDLREPLSLTSIEAVTSVMQLAAAAYQRQDLAGTERLMARPFLEVHPDDLKKVLGIMTESWLKAMVQAAGPMKAFPASTACARGVDAAIHQRYAEAAAGFAEAQAIYADLLRANPVAELLALGALAADKLAKAREAREPEIKALTEEASRLAVNPGRKAEAVPLLRKALALMDPKRFPEDRVRAAKFENLIQELTRGEDSTDPHDPGAPLPPEGSLTPAGWDELGMRLMPHRADSALLCFQRAAKGDAFNTEYRIHLAMALLATEASNAEVIAAFREAVRLAPKDARAQTGLAGTLQEARCYGEAKAVWRTVLQLQPDNDKAQAMRTFCGEAEALLHRGADLKPGDWVQIGMQLFDEGRWPLADLAFTEALDGSPGLLGAICGKGIANFRWGEALKAEGNAASVFRFRLARDFVEQGLAIKPSTPGLADVLAMCKHALGEG